MSAESIKENAIRKVIQELIVPDLSEIKSEQKVIKEKLNSLDEKIDSFRNELKSDIVRLDEKIYTNIVRLDEKINSLDDKLDTKIDALSEKVDYMNKTNERLFDIIFHSTGKENNRPK